MGYTWRVPKAIRQLGAKLYFERCGKNVDIGRKVKLSSKVYIGDRSGIGDECRLQGVIHIGNDVMMAPEVALIASNHVFEKTDIPMNQQGEIGKPIEIGNDVWLGFRSIVLSGVRIGNGSIVAAGAVVISNVSENETVYGIPALPKKKKDAE